MDASTFHHRKTETSSTSSSSEESEPTTPSAKPKTRLRRKSVGDAPDLSGSSDGSPSGSSSSGSKKKKAEARRNREYMSAPANKDACANWGVVVGKLMREKAIDFTNVMSRAGDR